jgi:phosphoserine aminotransferase
MSGERIYNFSAGPAVMPEEVLQEAREALWNLDGTGIGVLEHSHRGAAFTKVVEETEAACRRLAGIPDDYHVLFLSGGASTQFWMLPANLLPGDGTADYLVTGSWSKKAVAEAKRYGKVHEAASSAEMNHDRIPSEREIRWSERPVYAHFTSNNTIFGTQWQTEPTPPAGVWLACDASSDVFSRPIDVTRYGVLYAGAQKNIGPAGVTLVVIRRDLAEQAVRELPTMQRYATHAKEHSLYNTPPSFGVYLMGRVFLWIERQGGLPAMELDFYRPHAGEGSRSLMNVTFTTPSKELDAQFVKEAEAVGLSGLKGHRSVGGVRASIYNAFPKAGCEALAHFMRDFAGKRG